jgi:hypothetical protein
MEQIFKYPVTTSYWVFAIPVLILVALFGEMLFMAGFKSPSIPDQLVFSVIGFVFVIIPLLALILAWMRSVGLICVVCDDFGIQVKNVFRRVSVKWEEINEFGTYKTGFGANPAVNRVFCLKAEKYGSRRIRVCDTTLEGLDELIDVIFHKAVNAKFLREENLAMIPFIKKLRIDRWERN